MFLKNRFALHTFSFMAALLILGCTENAQNVMPQHTAPIWPALLEKNDKIAIVAPAFRDADAKEEKLIGQATEIFRAWGLKVVLGRSMGSKYGAFAGDDSTRAADLQEMFDDPTIRAIFTYKGGYGSTRIIDRLDFTKFLQHPKWVVGFSDITTILAKLHQLGVVSVHGEMILHFPEPAYQNSLISIKTILFAGGIALTAEPDVRNRIGEAEAPVVGGNLAVIGTNIGTQSDLDTRGKILVIEELGEHLYALDRMLCQLERTGKLAHLAGLVVGGMVDTKGTKAQFGKDAYEIIQSYVAPYAYPVAYNFPIGHAAPNIAFPHGGMGKLCVREEKVILNFW